MSLLWKFLLTLSFSCLFLGYVSAGKVKCQDPYYGYCYGIPLKCPPGCPKLCQVDCKTCKPYCDCDKPGAVCQDPRFIGGDGVMFYFHGRKDEDFCLLTDLDLHINGHFIGKRSTKGRDFTWVQSIGILFGPNQLYIGANKVSDWHDTTDYMHIQLNGQDVIIPSGDGEIWLSSETGVSIKRVGPANAIELEVAGSFKVRARVVPITQEESRIHGYDITSDDCFAHLELGFKFNSLSSSVNGVLGQTYAPGYRTQVKMGAPMPIMGGNHKFSSSHLFSTDCAVSRFGLNHDAQELDDLPMVACGGDSGARGMVCKR
ncbi:hypothetical protein LUZ62_069701 [Rhynchospora pubera]|uniref:Root cap n=1 Tax=Rhynchospora pubera TaxID=906938 RepID=A0AAV8CYI5_9POAL|nr:hypothetical protein LUZ62_069701 [Rhynchospora pubera]